jgi:hypothetical protein
MLSVVLLHPVTSVCLMLVLEEAFEVYFGLFEDEKAGCGLNL